MRKPTCLAAIVLSLAAPILSQSPPPTTSRDADIAAKLSKVKRVFVESFGDEVVSRQAQALVMDALTKSHRFIVTETKDRADATFKGVASEKSSQELHSTSEGTAVQGTAIADSETSTQTIGEARLAVRLVSNDGEVLWSTTQESKGAKYKGASADAVEKVVKQLLWDLDKLERPKRETSG